MSIKSDKKKKQKKLLDKKTKKIGQEIDINKKMNFQMLDLPIS